MSHLSTSVVQGPDCGHLTDAPEAHALAQTPSTGLRHPSFKEGAGKRCSECGTRWLYVVPVWPTHRPGLAGIVGQPVVEAGVDLGGQGVVVQTPAQLAPEADVALRKLPVGLPPAVVRVVRRLAGCQL